MTEDEVNEVPAVNKHFGKLLIVTSWKRVVAEVHPIRPTKTVGYFCERCLTL